MSLHLGLLYLSDSHVRMVCREPVSFDRTNHYQLVKGPVCDLLTDRMRPVEDLLVFRAEEQHVGNDI